MYATGDSNKNYSSCEGSEEVCYKNYGSWQLIWVSFWLYKQTSFFFISEYWIKITITWSSLSFYFVWLNRVKGGPSSSGSLQLPPWLLWYWEAFWCTSLMQRTMESKWWVLYSSPCNHSHQIDIIRLPFFSDDASSCNHVQSNWIMPSILGHVSQIGYLKKGLNPPSATSLTFMPPYIMVALKTGIVTGVIALAVSPLLEGLLWPNKDSWCPDHCSCSLSQEGIAVGRSFAMFKNYHIDGNKEMIAIGTMNMVGSLTSCYLTTGTVWSQDHFAATCCT